MLSRLLIEHDHIQKTLNLLEMQFLDLCRGRTPDYSIMLSIIVYIQEYPEQAHHPLEDAIFSVLLERRHDARLIRDLIKDHTELEVLTRRLRESLEGINSGLSLEEDIKRQLSVFLTRQRRHLYVEEMDIYPLAKRELTEQDWEAIQSSTRLMDDPVFGERTRNDYEILYHAIEGEETGK